jgi:hypothetical protein
VIELYQLLDSGEVVDETEPPKSKSRKKPLPATYEPGTSQVHTDRNELLITPCR